MPEKHSEKESGELLPRCSECTRRCRSRQHADLVSAAITQADDEPLISYLSWVCHAAATGTDSAGRTPLHVAASCGRTQLVEWLVRVRGVPLDTKDAESGMTALQRAVFYGQLGTVRTLLSLGASALTQDHADMTTYDGVHADRPPLVELTPSAPCEPYVWGANPWFSIGVERIKARPVPEPLDVFRRAGFWIRQIAMSKFHTVFVTQSGEVFSCGHGIGGRLGHGDEESVMAPRPVRALRGERCVQAAVSAEHTVLLTESGGVWTCGLNHACQLGHSPPPAQLTAPRLVDWSRGRRDRITGVCASRYHTVLWNSEALYCVGLNGGQLGQHKDENADKRFILPRKVTMLDRSPASSVSGGGALRLTHVTCSDGGTAAATAAGDVLLLSEYRCRRIASRLLNVRALRLAGGAPDPGSLPAGRAAESRPEPLRLLVITAAGQLLLWHQQWPTLTRCVPDLRRGLSVADAELDRHGLILLAESGQAFTATVTHGKEAPAPAPAATVTHSRAVPGHAAGTERDRHSPPKQAAKGDSRPKPAGSAGGVPTARLHLTRLPHIHRGVSVTCDGTGGSAAAVQCDPRAFLLEVPQVSPSQLRRDLGRLLSSADETDSIHDLVLLAGHERFPCHKFILASGSSYFSQQFAGVESGDVTTHRVDGVPAAALRQVLQFLYMGTCDLMRPGPTDFRLEPTDPGTGPGSRPQPQHKSDKKAAGKARPPQPLQVVREAARRLGVPAMLTKLDGVRLTAGRIELARGADISPAPLRLDPAAPPGLSDVSVVGTDGAAVLCHKCVLAARLEYFNMMLSSTWAESRSSEPVRLSVPGAVLAILLRYCYTDEALLQLGDSEQLQTDDLELLCGLLAAADHMLADRLKHICEVALSRQLTLKNAVEILEFSSLYGAEQLQAACSQFICLNLAALMENRTLEQASDEVLEQLGRYYRRENPAVSRRRLTPADGPPGKELIAAVHRAYPVSPDDPAPEPAEEEVRSRPPPRRRPSGRRSSGPSRGPGAEPQRQRAVSSSSVISLTASEAASEDGDTLPELNGADIPSSPVPEFTLVTRRRHPERTADQPPPPAETAAEQRYIPGMTPRPQPARAAPPDSPREDPVSPRENPGSPREDPGSPHKDPTTPPEAFPALGCEVTRTAAGPSPASGGDRPAEGRRSSTKKGRRGRPLALDGSPMAPAAAPVTPVKTETPRRPAWSAGAANRPAWTAGTTNGTGERVRPLHK
ncbi:inhibitor of Bruton tyrosine kinase-like [Amphibalanus amphitrite]|uniref:inhibitor of Bruton tyrosine kinase-like n=1 Tax=Amphibalanus amphitrite TaxID=1232801 RepID=UPI001C8FAD75|nr:inhibitor of Bruton tyrosine kinase-like [Amphibalanus amphitrite]